MKLTGSSITRLLMLATVTFVFSFAASTSAQVQTTTTTTSGKASKTVQVESGTVVLVQGNDLVIKMADGTIRHFPNVPESTRITVDGKSLGVHDLKPGMKLQRTITTTTTPQEIKTVQTVSGTVWFANPPNSVILTLQDGKNQSFKIPKGQQFNIDGQMVDAFGLRKGMRINATKVTETPEVLVAQHRSITGTAPAPAPAPQKQVVAAAPPPPPPPAEVPILIAVLVPEPTALPTTGSQLPLIALLGLLCLSFSLALKFARTSEVR